MVQQQSIIEVAKDQSSMAVSEEYVSEHAHAPLQAGAGHSHGIDDMDLG
jgi:hypothetical protein